MKFQSRPYSRDERREDADILIGNVLIPERGDFLFIMFTGIITQLGECTDRSSESLSIEGAKEFMNKLSLGSSVAVNGVCLTVSSLEDKSFRVDVMPETWEKTALQSIKKKDVINLELPLSVNGRFDGHIVQGHIDGAGQVKSIRQQGNSHLLTISVSSELTSYMVAKGSVALNGISLTLISVVSGSFIVGIIPYTYNNTMLQYVKVGDLMSIEADIMAKYFLKFFKEQKYEKN